MMPYSGEVRDFAHGFSLSRSEEHTSELQSHHDLVCRLLLEKKKIVKNQLNELTLRHELTFQIQCYLSVYRSHIHPDTADEHILMYAQTLLCTSYRLTHIGIY